MTFITVGVDARATAIDRAANALTGAANARARSLASLIAIAAVVDIRVQIDARACTFRESQTAAGGAAPVGANLTCVAGVIAATTMQPVALCIDALSAALRRAGGAAGSASAGHSLILQFYAMLF